MGVPSGLRKACAHGLEPNGNGRVLFQAYTFTASEVTVSVLPLLTSEYETETHDYEISGNRLIFLNNGNAYDEFEIILSDGTLHMTKDGLTMVLTKQ